MLIIWRGQGAWVFVITFGLLLASLLLADAIPGLPDKVKNLAGPLSAFLSALAVSLLVEREEAKQKSEEIVKAGAGRDAGVPPDCGSLFFIPTRYWGWILLGLAALGVAWDLAGGSFGG